MAAAFSSSRLIAWSGMMQTVCEDSYPGQSCFTFLPMIDMNPSDMSCVFTTLHFVSALARQYNVTPVITFDQPLWWKAKIITTTEPDNSPLRSIVLKLGGFHTEMSFLGCIGRLMAGSGLQKLLEVVYAPNAVVHMLSRSCTCRIHGLECSLACGECKGLSCLNFQQIKVDFDLSDVLENASVGADLPDLADLSSFLN